MRKLEVYVRKYGPEAGRKLYHALQSQAAHAGVSARLRKKIDVLTGRTPAPEVSKSPPPLPLFPDVEEAARLGEVFWSACRPDPGQRERTPGRH